MYQVLYAASDGCLWGSTLKYITVYKKKLEFQEYVFYVLNLQSFTYKT